MASSWLVLLVACAVLMPVDLRSLRAQQAREFLKLLRDLEDVDTDLKISADPPIDVGVDHEASKANAETKNPSDKDMKIPAEPPIDVGVDHGAVKSSVEMKTTSDYPDFTYLVGQSREQKRRSDYFSKLFKALENMDQRITVAKPDRSVQTLIQRMQKTSDNEKKLELNVCYFCDKQCVADISGSFSSPDAYFQTLTSTIQDEMKSLKGYNISAYAYDVLTPERYVDATQYCPSSGSKQDKLAAVNNAFWQENDLWSELATEGCDVGFYVVSQSDDLWSRRNCGGLNGIANMFQICRPHSYSTVKLDVNPVNMATLVLHELGHLLGIYHDDSVDRSFTRYARYFMRVPTLAAPYQNLVGNCTRSDQKCPLQGHCIEEALVASDHVTFSGCSIAYFEMFFELAKFWPYYYNNACLSA